MYAYLQYKNYSKLGMYLVTFSPGLKRSWAFAAGIALLQSRVQRKSYAGSSVSTDPGFCPVFANL